MAGREDGRVREGERQEKQAREVEHAREEGDSEVAGLVKDAQQPGWDAEQDRVARVARKKLKESLLDWVFMVIFYFYRR